MYYIRYVILSARTDDDVSDKVIITETPSYYLIYYHMRSSFINRQMYHYAINTLYETRSCMIERFFIGL
jgi:hypothetical protein